MEDDSVALVRGCHAFAANRLAVLPGASALAAAAARCLLPHLLSLHRMHASCTRIRLWRLCHTTTVAGPCVWDVRLPRRHGGQPGRARRHAARRLRGCAHRGHVRPWIQAPVLPSGAQTCPSFATLLKPRVHAMLATAAHAWRQSALVDHPQLHAPTLNLCAPLAARPPPRATATRCPASRPRRTARCWCPQTAAPTAACSSAGTLRQSRLCGAHPRRTRAVWRRWRCRGTAAHWRR